MKEIFFELPIKEESTFFLKIVALPLITFITIYLIYTIAMMLLKNNKNIVMEDFKIKSMVVKSYSTLSTLLLINVYFGFFIWFNGTNKFEWGTFPMEITNTYIQMIPILLSILVSGFMYWKNIKLIKKYI
tara:strand:+ start:247 stop:636 length:390 start_codon:yes stop_codon:yes gene_type:complete